MSDSPFDVVNEQLPITEAIYYATGQQPEVKSHSGKLRMRCPFNDHEDIHPSFDIDGNRWTCWTHPGGKITGSSVDFVMRWYNEKNSAAVKRAYGWLGRTWPQNGNGTHKKAAETPATKSKPKEDVKQPASETKAKPQKEPPKKYSDLKKLPFDKQHYEKETAKSVEHYTYLTPDGQPHMQVFRQHAGLDEKKFPQWTWNGSHYVNGCPEDTPKYLYRVEKLKDADVVFLVEGEKDVHSLEKLGLVATTWPGGAGTGKLQGLCDKWNILDPLTGKDIYFIPDNDESGEISFQESLPFLFHRVDELHKVKLPGLAVKGDVSDFIQINKDHPDIRELILSHALSTPPFVPDIDTRNVRYSDLRLQKIARPAPVFIVDQLIPVGLTIVGGKPKARKSTFCQQIGLAVSKGVDALGQFPTQQGLAIHCSLEEDDSSWNERLQKMLIGPNGPEPRTGKLDLVTNVDPLPGLLSVITRWKREDPDLKLVILDVLDFILGPKNKALFKGQMDGGYSTWYDVLIPLKKLAKKLGIGVVVVTHLKKGKSDDIFEDFIGSSALRGIPDASIALNKIFKHEYQGTLTCEGRGMRDIPKIALGFDVSTFTFNVVGDIDDFEGSKIENSIVDELQSEGQPLDLKELKERCGKEMSYPAFKQAIYRLNSTGRIEKALRGKYQIKTAATLQ
jgi:hypothetical protein